jgi:hypothetical protein
MVIIYPLGRPILFYSILRPGDFSSPSCHAAVFALFAIFITTQGRGIGSRFFLPLKPLLTFSLN